MFLQVERALLNKSQSEQVHFIPAVSIHCRLFFRVHQVSESPQYTLSTPPEVSTPHQTLHESLYVQPEGIHKLNDLEVCSFSSTFL
jgi:hypothetical protein